MSVSTATPSHTPAKTSATATAGTASSPIGQRIDTFISRRLKEAGGEGFSGVKDSAARASQLGFARCSNIAYANFLEEFRSSPGITAKYLESYGDHTMFIPWKGFHQVRRILDLWVDLPEFYLGSVPDSQIPWMEIFELKDEDKPSINDLIECFEMKKDDARFFALRAAEREMCRSPQRYPGSALSQVFGSKQLHEVWDQFESSYFVLAPKEAFATNAGGSMSGDWIFRSRNLLSPLVRQNLPPDDPVVGRFCRHGFIAVAAWGDEAESLNKIARDLELPMPEVKDHESGWP